MSKRKAQVPIEEIERIADEDGDTNQFFSTQREMRNGVAMKKRQVQAVRRNIDYSLQMFQRLNQASGDLNVPLQAIAKLAIQEWLDRRDLAQSSATQRMAESDSSAER